ncbi:hypothetical protein M3Y97_00618300 [Aphelenchoides bicaudatus]|nr:hypothetical protein M3Y97_00618300 [Aphelenchoides bicaudatus]
MLFKLIRSYTHPLMKPYIRILYTSVIIDFVSSISQYLSQARPLVFEPKKILTIALDGVLPRLASKFEFFDGGALNYALIPEYWGCYVVIAYCWMPFLYRYLYICWEYQMSRTVFFCSILFVCSISLMEAVLITHLSARAYDSNINHVPTPDPNCVRYLPQMDYMLNLTTTYDLVIFKVWYHTCYTFLQMTYFGLLFCAWKIYRFFKQQSILISSAQNSKIQFQITLTLCVQALIPAVVYFGPMITLIYIYRNESYTLAYYKIMYAGYSLIPIINPLLTMTFISSYRRALLMKFFKTVRRMTGITCNVSAEDNSIVPESSASQSNQTML